MTTIIQFPNHLEMVKHAADRNALRFYTNKIFSIPPEQQGWLEHYHLTYWSGRYFLQSTTDANGMVYDARSKRKYAILYTHSSSRGQILANPDQQIALSFRAPKAEWNLPAICLVSVKKGNCSNGN